MGNKTLWFAGCSFGKTHTVQFHGRVEILCVKPVKDCHSEKYKGLRKTVEENGRHLEIAGCLSPHMFSETGWALGELFYRGGCILLSVPKRVMVLVPFTARLICMS